MYVLSDEVACLLYRISPEDSDYTKTGVIDALLLARLTTSVRDSLRDLVSKVLLYRFVNSSILDKGPR